MQSTDLDLVARARRGDELACREIVDRHGNYLYRLAFSLVGNRADAADVLQETFAGAFRKLAGFEGRSSLKTWLTGILMRQAARHHRRRKREVMTSLESVGEVSSGIAASPGAVSETASDARIDVMAALATLSDTHREVIVLRELQGLSYQEMAEILGVPRGTVESRLFRARAELKERLRDYLL